MQARLVQREPARRPKSGSPGEPDDDEIPF